jgi:uncharacterized membrane protein YfcA
MELEILGYIAAVFIGLTLGIIGAGGSILTVPLLVYLFGIPATEATGHSLFIVGMTAGVGAYLNHRQGQVNWKVWMAFGLPATASVLLVRKVLMPSLEGTSFGMGSLTVTLDTIIMVVFSVLMLGSAIGMLRPQKKGGDVRVEDIHGSIVKLGLVGLTVGVFTGFVGAGGGFLIIPALVLIVKMPIKNAIGTSLAIITVKTLIGFGVEVTKDIQHGVATPWVFLLSLAGLAFLGLMIGMQASKKIDGKKLKPAFGWFVLAMAAFILSKETLFSTGDQAAVTPPAAESAHELLDIPS